MSKLDALMGDAQLPGVLGILGQSSMDQGAFDTWAAKMYGPEWRMQHPEDQIYMEYLNHRRGSPNPRVIADQSLPSMLASYA